MKFEVLTKISCTNSWWERIWETIVVQLSLEKFLLSKENKATKLSSLLLDVLFQYENAYISVHGFMFIHSDKALISHWYEISPENEDQCT